VAPPHRRSGCLPAILLLLVVLVGGSVVLWALTTDKTEPTSLIPPPVDATATVTKCEWTTYPGMGEWIEVAGQVAVGDIASSSVLLDLEHRIDGQLIGIGQGAANGLQPGQTANWIGVVRDVPPGGECIVLRIS
jgi:hypothetical protein